MPKTPIIINGATGRIGTCIAAYFAGHDQFDLVAKLDSQHDLTEELTKHNPTIAIDFTQPNCVYQNCLTIIENGAHPIIGTTGLTAQQIHELLLLLVSLDKKSYMI